MPVRRTICVVTGSRADYGLLQHIMRHLADHPGVSLQVVAIGMHLSPQYGSTWRQIEADGFEIHGRVELPLDSDTHHGMAKSTGVALSGMADAFQRLSPDLVLVLGDRFEIFAAAAAAALMRVPLAHIHGGEVTEGAIDDSLRHAITKLSHLHFTSAEAYRNRVIQMGESPDRVFCMGAPGIDSIASLHFLEFEQLAASLGFDPGGRFLLVTYHPVTLGATTGVSDMEELFAALDHLPEDVRFVITMPNADAGGRGICESILNFVKERPQRSAAFTSLGQLLYLSAMKHCAAVVGNSSSGIIEAPSLGVATVNIGHRQHGRLQATSVIQCDVDRQSILSALHQALTPDFRAMAGGTINPNGTSGASRRIANVLASHPLGGLDRKSFCDLT